jgi:hypothetical protein
LKGKVENQPTRKQTTHGELLEIEATAASTPYFSRIIGGTSGGFSLCMMAATHSSHGLAYWLRLALYSSAQAF